jgi:hypothetical protein
MSDLKTKILHDRVYFEVEPFTPEGAEAFVASRSEILPPGGTDNEDYLKSITRRTDYKGKQFAYYEYKNKDSQGRDIDLAPLIEEFPEDIDFNVVIHRGTNTVNTTEEYAEQLKDRTKAAWVILAKGLDLNIKDFPADRIDFWAPTREELSGISAADKAREVMYRTRLAPRKFRAGEGGYVGHRGLSLRREQVHLPIQPDGSVDLHATVHEMTHKYLNENYINVDPRGHGKVLNEGLATIGNYLPAMVQEGKMPELMPEEFIDSHFDEFCQSIDNQKDALPLADYAYAPANIILHWYLIDQRGGLDTMRKLMSAAQNPIEKYKVTRGSLIRGYQKVYGESMTDLVNKAAEWYKKQVSLSGSEASGIASVKLT